MGFFGRKETISIDSMELKELKKTKQSSPTQLTPVLIGKYLFVGGFFSPKKEDNGKFLFLVGNKSSFGVLVPLLC